MVEEVLMPNFHINIVAAYRKTWTIAKHGIDHEDIRVPPQGQVLGQREDDRVLAHIGYMAKGKMIVRVLLTVIKGAIQPRKTNFE
jgi:hypothetical protein